MLPEQVWDEERPELGMYLGKPTGAALPLLWAHSEYIQLVRSIADKQVFGRIDPVADRYLARQARHGLEIWKPNRQVASAARGATLRVQAPGAFRLRWTRDEWKSYADIESSDSGIDIHFVDFAVDSDQRAPLRFTFFWPAEIKSATLERKAQTWEGRDYTVLPA
jgi:glucoamylase